MYINLEPLRLAFSLAFTITFGMMFFAIMTGFPGDGFAATIGAVGLLAVIAVQVYVLWDMFWNAGYDSTE